MISAVNNFTTGKRARLPYVDLDQIAAPGTRFLNVQTQVGTPELLHLFKQGYSFYTTLNGEVIAQSYYANEADGVVEVFESDRSGNVLLSGAVIRRFRFTGKVRLHLYHEGLPMEELFRLAKLLLP